MQLRTKTTTNPLINDLRLHVKADTTIYICRINAGIQVAIKHAAAPTGKNITRGISQAFGYDLLPYGLAVSEWQIITDLVQYIPTIQNPATGVLNIELR